MPIFGSLPDSAIRLLADYVIALNQLGAMDAKAIRAYSRRTLQTSRTVDSERLASGSLVKPLASESQ